MPSREPELYKDKVEVSLDGRQIFYLFFGGAVIAGMVFVLGVMVGRRVEARGHLDRAETQAASDPLAALDRLERTDRLSFHGALTGSETPTDVEKAIGDLERRRAAGQGAKPADAKAASAKPADAKPADAKPIAPVAQAEAAAKPEAKPDGKADADRGERAARTEKSDKTEKAEKGEKGEKGEKAEKAEKGEKGEKGEKAEKGEKSEKSDKATRSGEGKDERADRSDKSDKTDKHDGDRKPRKHDDDARAEARKRDDGDTRDKKSHGEPVTRPESHADARPADAHDSAMDAKSHPEGKVRFTLQLSSFQDRAEAEAFLSATKSAGFQPYLTEADVSGKGTFYRVRLGSYRSLEAANDAKAEYEKSSRKTAQIMRL